MNWRFRLGAFFGPGGKVDQNIDVFLFGLICGSQTMAGVIIIIEMLK